MPAAKQPAPVVEEADPGLDLSAEAQSTGGIVEKVSTDDAIPSRPDVTPAQIVAGIPIVAELLHTFGVYDLSQAQQDSLSKTVTWAFVLIGGDAVIRLGRNLAKRL